MSAKADRIRDQFVQQTGAIDAITKPFDAQAIYDA
jgi:FixJ family two-component response regulator